MGKDQPTDSQLGVWVFYAVFFGLLAGEGFAVGLVLAVTRWMGYPHVGPWAAWILFIIGGSALAWVELRTIRPAQRMRDPVLLACCWLQRRFGVVGYLVNAGIIGGAPGAAVALSQTSHPRRVSLSVLASIVFASIWVPLFVLVWR
jgi:hypothetical protein